MSQFFFISLNGMCAPILVQVQYKATVFVSPSKGYINNVHLILYLSIKTMHFHSMENPMGIANRFLYRDTSLEKDCSYQLLPIQEQCFLECKSFFTFSTKFKEEIFN